jgi:hypothetical protein
MFSCATVEAIIFHGIPANRAMIDLSLATISMVLPSRL